MPLLFRVMQLECVDLMRRFNIISYEPIQGLVKGPAEFLEGIESGTASLARGVITGRVRGAARYVVGMIVG